MYLTKAMFEENLNTRFWLVDEHSEIHVLDLVELTNGHSSPRQEQFSLRFRGDREKVFPQRIYPMKHDAIGELELFLVPIARDDSGTFYEAVFNRFIKQEPVNQEQDQQKAS
ncbi:MAG TPA: hypothetical protein VK722_03875 [Candidatus Aquilonibacter sp.]|jgi:hypothetical protein|nr:hypothetical protein [Candidatus Aquilonibacter sp.]